MTPKKFELHKKYLIRWYGKRVTVIITKLHPFGDGAAIAKFPTGESYTIFPESIIRQL